MAEDGKVVIGTELDTTGFEQGDEKIKNETKKTEKVQNETLKKVKEEGKKTYSELAKESGKSVEEIKKDAEALAQSHIKNGKTAEEAYKLAYEKMGLYSKETMKEMEEANKKLESELKRIGSVAEKSINTAFYGGVAAVTAFSVASVKLASDLTEVQNVVDTTFGKNSETINAWAKDAISAYGLSELQAKKFTGTMGAMLKSSGLADDSLTEMSTTLVGLAGDFASFYNLDAEEAFSKIRAGISGETEPLKQLGINMSVANLEAYALTQGIETAYSAMSQAEQISLRYNYLLQAGSDASGDFAKTLDTSFANQMRVAQEEVKSMSAEFGQKLLPYAIDGIKLFRENTDEIIQFGTGVGVAVVALKGFLVVGSATTAVKKFADGAKIATVAQKALNLAWSTNPIGVVLLGVVALTGGLLLLRKEMDKQTTAEKELRKQVETSNEAQKERLKTIKEEQEARQEKVASDMVEIANSQQLYDELTRLVDANGNVSEANEARVNFILGALNSALGLELELIDGQIKGYQDLEQSIQDVITTKTAEIYLSAEAEAYAEALKLQKTAYDELGKSAKELKDIESDLAAAQDELTAAQEVYNDAQTAQQRIWASPAVTEAKNKVNDLTAAQEAQSEKLAGVQTELNGYLTTMTNYENGMAAMASGKAQEVVAIYTQYSSSAALAAEMAGKSADEQKKILEDNLAAQLLALTTAYDNQENEVTGYNDEYIRTCEEAAATAYDLALQGGANIVDGVIAGINFNKSRAFDVVRSFYSEMQNVGAKTDDSHSPSKKYMEQGKNKVDGITLGIEQNKRKPIDEIKRLSLDMQAAFTSPLQSNRGAVYTTNNTNNSKTITQVFNTQLTSPFEAYRKAVQNV